MRLSAANLACLRGGRWVFAGLSFQIAAGETMAVTGRNGAGKTSLLRVIAGLLRPAHGRVTLEGGNGERSLAEQAHYLAHSDPAKPALTVSENLGFWTHFLGGKSDNAALERVGLAQVADLPAGYLSAGQRRRLSLARLLAAIRPIWLLDEPGAALDAAGQDLLRELMRDHLGAGGIIVAAVHEPLRLEGVKELKLADGPVLPPGQNENEDGPSQRRNGS
jgi:heme exporter protein A